MTDVTSSQRVDSLADGIMDNMCINSEHMLLINGWLSLLMHYKTTYMQAVRLNPIGCPNEVRLMQPAQQQGV